MTDNAGLKGAAQIAAEQVASTKNVRIKPDIVERLRGWQRHYAPANSIDIDVLTREAAAALEVCQAERDQARRSAKFWNENSADLSAQIAELTDALIAAKARAEKAEAEIERLRGALTIVPGTVTEEERQWAIDEIAKQVGGWGDEAAERIAKARNEALEEAAKVADQYHPAAYAVAERSVNTEAERIAAAIRAMKGGE